ncbi:hypothetical protein CPB86DRAFT_3844 [Serendipita vermifera]|nr:hypothetical protein CPB86DRAFT_3844 [Serendipita vermifera]
MDQDPVEIADWGDDEETSQPVNVPESENEHAEAEVLSLASEEDDLEALKKYHKQTWDSTNAHEIAPSATVANGDISKQRKTTPPQDTKTSNVTVPSNSNSTIKESYSNPHGLPPKPPSPAFTRSAAVSATSVSATAMAPREGRKNGLHGGGGQDSRTSYTNLPQGWEYRTSSKGEVYYYNTIAQVTQWDFPTRSAYSRADSQERDSRRQREPSEVTRNVPSNTRRSRSREKRDIRRAPSPYHSNYRPRSRSLDRPSSYRPRDASPRREASNLSREVKPTRMRSPPRARRPSPTTYTRPSDYRDYSPPHGRTGQEDYSRGRRPEPIQNSSSVDVHGIRQTLTTANAGEWIHHLLERLSRIIWKLIGVMTMSFLLLLKGHVHESHSITKGHHQPGQEI